MDTHNSFPGKRADWADKALSNTGQLAMYRDALFQVKGTPVSTWIHFAVGGGLIEMRLA